MKMQNGFAAWWLLVAVLVIVLGGVVAYRSMVSPKSTTQPLQTARSQTQPSPPVNSGSSQGGGQATQLTEQDVANVVSGANTAGLPACPEGMDLLHHSLINDADIAHIDPLGHMFGEHVIPPEADHVYVYSVPSKSSPVYAPADVALVAVVKSIGLSGVEANGSGPKSIFIAPCRSVVMALQLSTFSQKITDALAATKPTSDQKATLVENITYTNLNIPIKTGEQLGTIGDPGFSNSLDFAMEDVRIPPLAFLNQKLGTGTMGDSYLHTVCPLDYFDATIKQSLYTHITTKNAGANGIPACGTTMQDKAGTAQGDWYRQGTEQSYDTSPYLALAHENTDPTQAVLSAGTDLLPSKDFGSQIFYAPKSSGVINRDPSQITADGQVYCISGQLTGSNGVGHVNIQLSDSATLKAEYGPGSCVATPTLSAKALTYAR